MIIFKDLNLDSIKEISVEENNLMFKECNHFCNDCARKEECNSLSEDSEDAVDMNRPYAMISQGMKGKTDEEITKVRIKAIEKLESLGYYVIESFFNDAEKMNREMNYKNVITEPVYYLSKAIEQLSKVAVIYFTKDWEKYRGCRIEHIIATQYNIPIMYEE